MQSITLSNLSWSLPEGRTLFSELNVHFEPVRTGLVGRNGVGKTTLFKLIAGELQPQGGTISVHGSLGILRQTVQVASEETIAHLFGVAAALELLNRAEAGLATIDELSEADWTLESRMELALQRVGLDAPPTTLLSKFSGGQRTRLGLAALIFAEPDFILLDEPTNNLDRGGRQAVIELLAGWRKGAIIVSHDRELLETVDVIVELTSLGATRYGGNWSHYRERKTIELAAAQHDLADAERRIQDAARRAQATVERKARKDSAGQKSRSKGGAPKILLDRAKNRSENTSGENARLAENRRAQALEEAAEARRRIEILQPVSVVLSSTGLPGNKTVLNVDNIRAGYEPGSPIIRDVSLNITGPERVAVVGANGSGKTTFLKVVAGELQPWTGSVQVMTDFAMLDQQVSLLDPAMSVLDNFRQLNPTADENACRAALARLMFRSDTALQLVSSLSGGQLLRAGLACVLGSASPSPLLILDEPTNHLDVESIEAVEAGLRAYDGALLVVSHDEPFLAAINITRTFSL